MFSALLKEFLNVRTVEVLEPKAPKPDIPVIHIAKPKLKVISKKIGKKMAAALKKYAKHNATELTEPVQAGEPFDLDLNGEPVTLYPEDFILEERSPDRLAFAEDKGAWVSFDTTLDDDLRLEGLMRDLLRHLQVLRKKIGLDIEDRIRLIWQSEESKVRDIFGRWEDFLKAELLCVRLEEGQAGPDAHSLAMGEIDLSVEIIRAS